MHPVIEKYLSKLNNLSALEPKNLPFDVLEALAQMNEGELFKTCSQLFILKNNIPSENNLINLSEEEIIKGATSYADEILLHVREKI